MAIDQDYRAKNRGKVFFPSSGHRKGDVVDYYDRVAPIILPHLRDRPLTLERYPDGIEATGFIQKNASDHFPDWLRRSRQSAEEGHVDYVVARDRRDLQYLADQGCITLHAWLSREDRPTRPDRVIIDLDPPGDDAFDEVRFAARCLKERLEAAGLAPFVMTTGSRGLHVVAPIERDLSFDAVRSRARRLAEDLAEAHPDRLTTATRKDAREGRVFLDYLRNAYGQTTVVPYSIRPRPGAPIAAPLDWDEIGRLGPRDLHLDNIFRRLGQKDDPWATIAEAARPLDLPE